MTSYSFFTDDRRKNERDVRKDITVTFKKSFFSSTSNRTYLLNISTQGAAICCRNKLSKKNTIHLNVAIKNGSTYSIKGKVIHIQNQAMFDPERDIQVSYFQYGIQFITPPRGFTKFLIETSLKNKLKPNN